MVKKQVIKNAVYYVILGIIAVGITIYVVLSNRDANPNTGNQTPPEITILANDFTMKINETKKIVYAVIPEQAEVAFEVLDIGNITITPSETVFPNIAGAARVKITASHMGGSASEIITITVIDIIRSVDFQILKDGEPVDEISARENYTLEITGNTDFEKFDLAFANGTVAEKPVVTGNKILVNFYVKSGEFNIVLTAESKQFVFDLPVEQYVPPIIEYELERSTLYALIRNIEEANQDGFFNISGLIIGGDYDILISDEDIIEIQSGIITAKAVGTADITLTSKLDSEVFEIITITVLPVALSEIIVEMDENLSVAINRIIEVPNIRFLPSYHTESEDIDISLSGNLELTESGIKTTDAGSGIIIFKYVNSEIYRVSITIPAQYYIKLEILDAPYGTIFEDNVLTIKKGDIILMSMEVINHEGVLIQSPIPISADSGIVSIYSTSLRVYFIANETGETVVTFNYVVNGITVIVTMDVTVIVID